MSGTGEGGMVNQMKCRVKKRGENTYFLVQLVICISTVLMSVWPSRYIRSFFLFDF